VSFSSKQKKDHKKFTLEGSLREFFSQELIKVDAEGKHGYQCEKCKNVTSAIKISQIDESPEYLTIHVKRFKFQGSSSHKLKEPLQYPMDLDVGKYSVSGQDIRYRLMTVVVHEGRTASSGHYIALCRQPNNTLVEYDDETTRKVSERYFLKQESAYMFIYCKLLSKKSLVSSNPERLPNSAGASGSPLKNTTAASPELRSPRSPPVKGLQVSKRAGDEIDKIFEKRAKTVG
jgi:ubiquitin carboxyl-terminal hydrolase 10